MKKLFGVLILCGAVAMPAMAQQTPEQTNLDQSAAAMEARNARGNQLTEVSSDQARANALKRCDNLPADFKEDCVSRVNGEGQVDGSVIGGGLIKETRTTYEVKP